MPCRYAIVYFKLIYLPDIVQKGVEFSTLSFRSSELQYSAVRPMNDINTKDAGVDGINMQPVTKMLIICVNYYHS